MANSSCIEGNARRPRFPCAAFVSFGILLTLSLCPPTVLGQDTANLSGTSGRITLDLRPTTQPVARTQLLKGLDLNGWTYRSVRSPNPRDGVPWELIATPSGPIPEGWRKGIGIEAAGLGPTRTGKGDVAVRGSTTVFPFPIVEVPEILWKQWMASDLQDVVGIHYHEVVSDDLARVLFTLHKIPPDAPETTADGPRNGGKDEKPMPPEVRGTRIEATLLAPVTFSLDQSIAVRIDAKKKELTQSRAQHEVGHAEMSQQVYFAVLAGPQDWKPQYSTGRRSRIEYYWRREQIGRTWDGYRGGKGEIIALRTTVVLVPPTRWSMMLPIPPERVTQKQLQEFNDAIVRVSQVFAATDAEAQHAFHAQHGEFEAAREP